ncbi:bifunctional alpha,alpha-trehalose-phosphate synthase (UDP-forming)/trehalose-phosphatase [Pontibacter akesuensis]|uniref:Alpha,alpha-trehalose-phosphate synthase n=1 Tax=Pontibacter akesuensis TaxID=388950 RepID=A0A1I7KF83_9BACT|nr:bifunctional alpha,alpha-trehalose-phosphate synthase (UDP-forming)/trehalose-phosphatase [Pontibacter akesuensis]GHA79639.1 bifunctional alpha,alpha-trehalose-phosphate synthase (UDP-forming)/trehalose-phosphatase [Pontibacter akesuensis]SFU96093.1 trehalose 6-phosphate synthase/phosphatase [Pontibacter akesuensis]
MAKLIIVSNRLPVKLQEKDGKLSYHASEGGLATGLGSFYKKDNNLWIGWPGLVVTEDEKKGRIADDLNKENMHPVFLTDTEIKEFYEGFSNETLWPTFHYFSQYAVYSQQLWETYVKVNQKFCEVVLEQAGPEDTIWVHDYQLLLLPSMLRERLPDSTIGFFQHIPFPSYEVFRLLPWRKELLEGMLGSDLVGFHTYDDMRHFLSSVNRIVGYGSMHGWINTPNRSLLVDSFPMGIDYEKYAGTADTEEVKKRESLYRSNLNAEKIILSIDRLDYSKGIAQRLEAFDKFLAKYPEFHKKVTLLMLVVPSRDAVEKYKELKEEVDELVGRINGQYSSINWNPIQYFYRSYPLETLSAFYRMADVGLVTPMRDGMNLVCKEYVASKLDQKGVLILSEMAGASKELSDAILINPNDINQMVEALHQALTMPEEEQVSHMRNMQESLKRYNIHHWVSMFMDRLSYVKIKQLSLATSYLDESTFLEMSDAYDSSRSRLFFLEYDGALVDYRNRPLMARPDDELMELLESLSSNPKNRVVVMSSREKATMQDWLGHLNIDIIAEHGVWIKQRGTGWQTMLSLMDDWKKDIRLILDLYVDRTPASFIEEKEYSLVWHYRRVETGLGELRARELVSHLNFLASNSNLQVLDGQMAVEIKAQEINKGKASSYWLSKFPHKFVLAVGDDWGDEDIFKAMPRESYTVKVGNSSSVAKYHVDTCKEAREMLSRLVQVRNQEQSSGGALMTG